MDGRGGGHRSQRDARRHEQPVLEPVELGDLVELALEDGQDSEEQHRPPALEEGERPLDMGPMPMREITPRWRA